MPTAGRGIHQTYALISEALRRGFIRLGADDITFSRSEPDFRAHYESFDSEGCFSASALNELAWKGKKVVGSAQRRYDSILLQHGSILLGEAHLDIVDVLRMNPESRPAMRERLRAKTATLGEIIGGALPSFDVIAAALLEGFVETFAFVPVTVDPTDAHRVRE
jgi:lipoate-protein ligase A